MVRTSSTTSVAFPAFKLDNSFASSSVDTSHHKSRSIVDTNSDSDTSATTENNCNISVTHNLTFFYSVNTGAGYPNLSICWTILSSHFTTISAC
jgi:hypothetical protein